MDGDAGLVWRELKPGAKPAAKVKADLTFAVSAKGVPAISIAPMMLSRLLWLTGDTRLRAQVSTEGDVVYLRLLRDAKGAYGIRGAVRARKDGQPSRGGVTLYGCSDIEFSTRKAMAIDPEDIMCARAGELVVRVPRLVDEDPAGEAEVEEVEDADEVAKPAARASSARAAAPPPPARSQAKGETPDIDECLPVAWDHAHNAWPVEIDRDARPVRIAAAVALVEFGCNAEQVRDALSLQGFVLETRDKYSASVAKAATAALDALEA